ncbi:class I histocompatibility antigen, F10 alpha chain-like isoform X7 [Pygocentrus nattereri]|uniref:class I histocompatibility antigen, F10 alpha chain-like isoform X7 n=1 Tax=Pygocentrus nattereri TaxID=42514 RepID=UPI001890B870|nr:class I histocompatibility antigen, F10 alpha chain-like isoform X7 [Pygocentrus nattereri]
MGVSALVCAVLLCGGLVCALGDKHSLYYIYTALSKDVALPGIYEFTALGLLDDREIDYYNSQEQVKVPKQDWMKEKLQPDYWDKGTQSRKSKEQWFKVNVEILMQRMRHNETNLHILQWRHGCEIEEADGNLTFLRGIDEYSYDGDEFLSFDDENMRWIASVAQALPTKRKWDDVAILNQYTKGYLEKECVDWLSKFMQYGKESLRNHSKPEVHAFAKKSTTNSDKLTLTCLATGFYPKDVTLRVRKFRTSLPEHLLTSSGVRPNDDGTYQLRKSVEIQEDETAEYDCYVNHSTLEEPIIKQWDKMCFDCQSSGSGAVGPVIGGVVGLLLSLLSSGGIIFALIKKGIIANPCSGNATPALQASLNGNKAGVTNGAANGHPEGESLMSNGNGHMHENGMNGAPATA